MVGFVSVGEQETAIVTRLGERHATVEGPDKVFVLPLLDRVHRYDTSTQSATLRVDVSTSQRDRVHLSFEATYSVTDAGTAFDEIKRPYEAVEALIQHSVRDAVTEQGRDNFNRAALEDSAATDANSDAREWGITVHDVTITGVQWASGE